jgi:hypothetical protein
MKSIFYWCVISFVCSVTSFGQVFSITPHIFNTLIPNYKEGYCYVGDGRLVAIRSCRIIWIDVKFDEVTFNKADSLLMIRGAIYNDAAYENPLLTGVKLQILIGKIIIDSLKGQEAYIKVRNTIPLNQAPYFKESIKIMDGDFLCFALAANDDSTYPLGWVKLYEVGKVLE